MSDAAGTTREGAVAGVDHRPDLRLGAGLAATLLAAIAGPAVWAWSVRDRLPEEVARHWAVDGRVTGTWSLATQLWVLGATALLVAGVFGAVAVVSRQPVMLRRSLAGCAAWTAVVLGATQVDALRGQLDLTDPSAAPAPGVGLAVGALAGVLIAVAVALLATEAPHLSRAVHPPPPELPRTPGDGVPGPFVATSPPSRGLLVVIGVVAVAATVSAVFGLWWIVVFALVTLAPIVALTRVTTHIDQDGLRVTAGGVTLVQVPIAQVEAAVVIDHLDGFWEFGGWGLRVDVHGRTGVVGRSGPAIDVRRADGSDVIVTIQDAATAAATLNRYADLHHDARTET